MVHSTFNERQSVRNISSNSMTAATTSSDESMTMTTMMMIVKQLQQQQQPLAGDSSDNFSWTSMETEDETSSFSVSRSAATDTNTSSYDTLPPLQEGVRFAETADGQLSCEYHSAAHVLENEENFLLWWQPAELAAIRQGSLQWIQKSQPKVQRLAQWTEKAFLLMRNHRSKQDDTQQQQQQQRNLRRRLLMQMAAVPEARGLEHAVMASSSSSFTTQHVQTVVQAAQTCTSGSRRQVRRLAKQSSQPAVELALTRAQHDRKEAQKASLSSWGGVTNELG